jgi:hypothetical protein
MRFLISIFLVWLALLPGVALPFQVPAVADTSAQPAVVAVDQNPEAATGKAVRSVVLAPNFMVVSANPLATAAGRRMLEQGGSAADAAIAMQWVLGLVEPQSSGLGGGGFAVSYDARSGLVEAYDGRETAPADANVASLCRSIRRCTVVCRWGCLAWLPCWGSYTAITGVFPGLCCSSPPSSLPNGALLCHPV